jgi:hypothetical protein
MKTIIRHGLSAAIITLMAQTAFAQETNRVAANTDWSGFVGASPKECWAVSAPKETVNTKDGKAVAVRRGDIRLFVTFRPGKPGEVSFMGGYPFAPGSTVDMNIGGKSFTLFTDGEGAWAGSPEEDAKIIAALKAGSDATLSGGSSRGTKTKDKFSLLGFTATIDEAGKQCK